MDRKLNPLMRWAGMGAVVFGLGVGSYGIASAAGGSGSTASSSSGVFNATATTSSSATAPPGWGPQRSDETLLTGDALAKVTAVAKDALPGATIVRVETDADGNAAYEAHVTKSDGTLATVYVDASFKLVSVETGMPGGPGGHGGPGAGYGVPSASSSAGAIA
jgi:hypothetical protein